MKNIEEFRGTITTKGQITLPIQIRQRLGVKAHDQIIFRVSEGKVELWPVTRTLEDTFGAVSPRQSPEDFQELRDIAIEEHVQKVIDDLRG